MRRLFTTGLLLLQVPALTHGLPVQLQANNQAPILDSPSLATTPTLQPAAAAPAASSTSSKPPPAEPEGDLARELADLRALRGELAALAREVHRRETWLAGVSGTAFASAPPSVADCDGLGCVARAVRRKVRHAVGGGSGEDRLRLGVETGIPRPPWRGEGGGGEDEEGGAASLGGDDGGCDLLMIVVCSVLLLPFLVLVAYGGCRVREATWRRRRSARQHLTPGCLLRENVDGIHQERPLWPRYTDDERSEAVDDSEFQSDEEDFSENEKRAAWHAEQTATPSDRGENPEEPRITESRIAGSTIAEELRDFRSAVSLVESLIAGEEARMASRQA